MIRRQQEQNINLTLLNKLIQILTLVKLAPLYTHTKKKKKRGIF